MQLPPLKPGRLVKRYKRFLADIETEQGLLTAHCPNTGAMTGCAEPGWDVWYSLSDNPKRKYAATWELVATDRGICCVNTGFANKLVHEAVAEGFIQGVGDPATLKREVAIPAGNGRFDLALEDGAQRVFIEVKSVTLCRDQQAGVFPDAVSTRATKHVSELLNCVHAGDRGVLIFCAQHCGIESVAPAVDIDPDYAAAVASAAEQGVEVLAYGCSTDFNEMRIDRPLEFALAPESFAQ